MNAAVYARVSTLDQEPENQLQELRRYIEARGWQATEFIDKGVSGARESRPALDTLVKDARRRRFDTLAVWRLDRLGRNLRHLILLLDELTALGVAFVSLNEGIDTSTPAGRLQLHILGAIAEFERARIQERVRAGLARARAQGQHLGRPRVRIAPERLQEVAGLTVAEAAAALRVSPATLKRLRRSSKSSAISLEISARFRWVRCPAHPRSETLDCEPRDRQSQGHRAFGSREGSLANRSAPSSSTRADARGRS